MIYKKAYRAFRAEGDISRADEEVILSHLNDLMESAANVEGKHR